MNSIKKIRIRLRHWEYWPFHVVYGPVYLYWFWLCLRARSFFFFNTSNPTIRHGGFLMESKKEIYDLLPAGSYPVTAFCEAGISFTGVLNRMEENSLRFPLIAKPDIGLRGMSVALIKDKEELERYHATIKVDYLLQEYIDYPEEAGIFYCRYPGAEKGFITGIVGKEFLKVKGDGKHSIRELLQLHDRYVLQLGALELHYGKELDQRLPVNETRLLVPFGNHCRGARFLDITNAVTGQLEETIDDYCKKIPGFYYGRLDIKYLNWEDFLAGKNFSVIELNGAGSEPAHIYDPSHSIFFGWKEIIRHWNILYRVSRMNRKKKKLSYMTTKEGLKMFRDNNRQVKLIQ